MILFIKVIFWVYIIGSVLKFIEIYNGDYSEKGRIEYHKPWKEAISFIEWTIIICWAYTLIY